MCLVEFPTLRIYVPIRKWFGRFYWKCVNYDGVTDEEDKNVNSENDELEINILDIFEKKTNIARLGH